MLADKHKDNKKAKPCNGAAIETYPLTKPPPMGRITDARPVFGYGKAKVYTSVASKCWRVKPDWKNYDNDKAFPWKDSPKAVWQEMLDYCKKPNIPKTWKHKA